MFDSPRSSTNMNSVLVPALRQETLVFVPKSLVQTLSGLSKAPNNRSRLQNLDSCRLNMKNAKETVQIKIPAVQKRHGCSILPVRASFFSKKAFPSLL